MTDQLPPNAQAQLGPILEKVLGLLDSSREHTSARSEFMNYDGSMGGQVLECSPPIEHPYEELATLYNNLFEQAQKEGLELREIETLFERDTPKDVWSHRTRWLATAEFKAFTEKIQPVVAEIGVALRKIGPETAGDWYKVSFDPGPENARVLVLHGDRVRVVKQPTPELLQLVARISQAAQDDGLELTGANWSVRGDDEDDEVDSAVGVKRAWPAAK
jgi:hypothetical protein